MRINLVDARKKKQLRQIDVAAFLGITQATYSKYEAGNLDLSLDAGLKLAQLLEVSPEALLVLEPALAATEE